MSIGTRDLVGSGDDTYISGPSSDGSMRMHVRRGHGVFEVDAPSEEFVQRITRALVPAIDRELADRDVAR